MSAREVERTRRRRTLIVSLWVATSACSKESTSDAAKLEPPIVEASSAVGDAVVAAVGTARAAVLDAPEDVDARYRLAVLLDANGLAPAAERAYSQLVRIDPTHARGWYHLARVRRDLGDPGGAGTALGKCIEIEPSYAAAHARRGDLLLDAAELDAAEAAYRRATEIDPGGRGGVLGLARVLIQREQYDEASRALEPLVAADPSDGAAAHLLGTALRLSGDVERAAPFVVRGGTAERSWSDPWAEEVLRHRVGLQVEKARAWERLRGASPEALIPLLEEEHRAAPDDLGVLGALAEAHCRQGSFDAAFEVVERARRARPDHPRVLLMLGLVHELKGEIEKALDATRRAVAAHPEFASGHYRLGVLEGKAGRGPAALLSLREAKRLGLDDFDLHVNLGAIERMLGENEHAVRSFEHAVRVAPASFEANLFLARACGEAGHIERGFAALARAREIDPGHAYLGVVEARLRELSDASGAAR